MPNLFGNATFWEYANQGVPLAESELQRKDDWYAAEDARALYDQNIGGRASQLAAGLEDNWGREGRYLDQVLRQPSQAAMAQGRGLAGLQRSMHAAAPGNLAQMRAGMMGMAGQGGQLINEAGAARGQEDIAKLAMMREYMNRRNQYHLAGEDMENQMLGSAGTAAAQLSQQEAARRMREAGANAAQVGMYMNAGAGALAGLGQAMDGYQGKPTADPTAGTHAGVKDLPRTPY